MLFIQPLPHEFCLSHLSRMLAVNGAHSLPNLIFKFKNSYGKHPERRLTELFHHEFLAQNAGMTWHEYRQKHSLLPVIKLMQLSKEKASSTKSSSGIHDPIIFHPHSASTLLPFKLCPDCHDEDIRHHGLAYWHREHQIAGIEVCPWHGAPLAGFPSNAVMTYPNPRIDEGTVANRASLTGNDHPILVRFRHTILEILNTTRTPSSEHAGQALINQALAKGIRVSYGAPGYEFRAYLHDLLPPRWLRTHLTSANEFDGCIANLVTRLLGKYGDYPREIDNLQHSLAFVGHFLLLVLCSLFDTTDEILDAIYGAPPLVTSRSDSGRNHAPMSLPVIN